MLPWTECPNINVTHIPINDTAIKLLSMDEILSLKAAILSLNQTDSSCIKPHFRPVWPLYVFLYTAVAISGATGNVYMIFTIISETSCRRFINFLLFNLCFTDLFKCIVVLPLSLYVLSLAHWRLGSWLCYASPLLQTLPVVVTMLTYFLIALERYFLVFRPSRHWKGGGATGRLLHLAVMCGVWVCSVCTILPLKASVRYYDLTFYFGLSVGGYGFCAISFDSNTKEINCALFIVLFVIPLAFITYLMTKTNQELNSRLRSENQLPASASAQVQQTPQQQLLPSSSQLLTPAPLIANDHRHLSRSNAENLNSSSSVISSARRGTDDRSRRSFLAYIDHERTQLTLLLGVNRCICTMLALFALCWTPLEIVMLICYIIPETPETSTTVDVLFVVFTLMGLLSTVVNPALLMYQKKSVQVVLNTGIQMLRRLSSGDSRRRRSNAEDDLSQDLKTDHRP